MLLPIYSWKPYSSNFQFVLGLPWFKSGVVVSGMHGVYLIILRRRVLIILGYEVIFGFGYSVWVQAHEWMGWPYLSVRFIFLLHLGVDLNLFVAGSSRTEVGSMSSFSRKPCRV